MRISMCGAAAAAIAAFSFAGVASGQTVFDDFNVDEGHFNLDPDFSGSNSNVGTGGAGPSTADRVTSPTLEGAGAQEIVVIPNTSGIFTRVRFLSGGGSAGSNTPFTTGAGTNGWIGFYAMTTDPGWTSQLWIEGASVNGGVPKAMPADGEWHLFEWNLDDTSGGPDGWGDIAGILGGSATVAAGSHTIDSIVFRNDAGPASSTLYLDFVAHNPNGSIASIVPEPTSLAAFAGLGLLGLRRRRA